MVELGFLCSFMCLFPALNKYYFRNEKITKVIFKKKYLSEKKPDKTEKVNIVDSELCIPFGNPLIRLFLCFPCPQGDTSGDYRKVLLILCGGDD